MTMRYGRLLINLAYRYKNFCNMPIVLKSADFSPYYCKLLLLENFN